MLTQSKKEILNQLWAAYGKKHKDVPTKELQPLLLSAFFIEVLSAAIDEWSAARQNGERVGPPPAPLAEYFTETHLHDWNACGENAADMAERFKQRCEFLETNAADQFKDVFTTLSVTGGGSNKKAKAIHAALNTILATLGTLDLQPQALERPNVPAEVFGELLFTFGETKGREGLWTFATPSVERLMVELAKPNAATPQCVVSNRTGTLAVEIQRYLTAASHDASTDDHVSLTLCAEEVQADAWALSKLHLLLAGVSDQTIKHTDSLVQPALVEDDTTLQTFETVFAMPPLARSKKTKTLAEKDAFQRFPYGAPSTSQADWAYIQDAIARANDTGTAYVLASPAVLFRGGGDRAIREAIIRADLLSAVIHLPEGTFTHTNIAPALMIFERQRKHQGEVLFVHAADAFEERRNTRILTQDHIDQIVSVVHDWRSEPRFSQVVKLQEIQAKEFNLQVTRYVDTYKPVWTSSLEDAQKRLQTAEARRSELAQQMDVLLAEMQK